ncbi:MAG: cytidylate kinase-like family protein [Lachnospiraceae bacterium]|nr:cytidylate kinase-like family protein [Lachnospiraceae bacterium]
MGTESLPIITISREYAAGGRSVAKGLSERLSIPWYDKDFNHFASEKSGFSEEDILQEGEEMSEADKFIDSVMNSVISYVSSHDAIFKAQKEAILELSKEPCIIVGRCANLILREAKVDTFDVFLYANNDVRIKRAMELLDASESEAKKVMKKKDVLRSVYYKNYTHRALGDYHDYNMCIDTGKIGYDATIDMLEHLIRNRK